MAPIDQGSLYLANKVVTDGIGALPLIEPAPDNLAAQLSALTSLARVGDGPIVMIDEEGGAVQRLAPPVPNVI